MTGQTLETCGLQTRPDRPDRAWLKAMVESPRFRAGLLIWYVDEKVEGKQELWDALVEEVGGGQKEVTRRLFWRDWWDSGYYGLEAQ